MRVLHVFISGRVQGVSYRASAQAAATELGLVGWVRNLRDGRVEAVVQGADEDVATWLAWAHEGPPHARVDGIAEQASPQPVSHARFEVRPTA